MAPLTRKRKLSAATERYLCFSCDNIRTSKQFADYNPSPDCDHLINTCKTCLKKWVEVNVKGSNYSTGSNFPTGGENSESGKTWGIKCPHPQCEAIMRNVNVEEAGTKKIHALFEEAELKHIGNTTPGWRWCLAPGCKAGQVHQSKVETAIAMEKSKPKKRRTKNQKQAEPIKLLTPPSEPDPEAEADICTCHTCGAKACVTCDRPFHEGEGCEQYQFRTKDRMEEEVETLNVIRETTKSCPSCAKKIEKNGGCPSMICTMCHANWCWTCCRVFTQQGCGCVRRR